jgi:phosphoserine phosphatase
LPDDRFITAFIGFLDPATHQVNYHSGGQGPILHYQAAEGVFTWHKPTSFPVGIMEIEDIQESAKLELGPGDILGLISDGIYEYANLDGEQFGEIRVADVIGANENLSMADLSETLIKAVREFGGEAPQADDITLVLVRRLPE